MQKHRAGIAKGGDKPGNLLGEAKEDQGLVDEMRAKVVDNARAGSTRTPCRRVRGCVSVEVGFKFNDIAERVFPNNAPESRKVCVPTTVLVNG